ncbi:ankyrin [Decorospora gaudefroyi]|uniref:Ankyrin n=1 Tax=Decorospora gaudefroyi TaxID=184978 RepID=A0A6A5KK89_9PLEO|nr:ankyrin [Decorospora gaudefroyi]
MQLLDLPLEIFSEIIHAHVRSVGWIEAAKSRYVCKTFASAIHHDMFSRYRLFSFHAGVYPSFSLVRRQRLLEANMHTILFKMTPKRCDATYLLDHMDATLNFLMDFSFYKSREQRERYKAALCIAISTALSLHDIVAYLDHGPYDNSVKIRKNMYRADTIGMLAAAAAVNNEQALCYLVNKVRSVSTCSELYGAPLLAAAANGHVKAAVFLYDHMQDEERLRGQLQYTINQCILKGRATLLPLLISWLLPLLSKREQRRAIRSWKAWAAGTGNIDVMHMFWKPGARPGGMLCVLGHPQFRQACALGHTDMVQYFIDRASWDETLDVPIDHHCNTSTSFCAITSGLWAAAAGGWWMTTKLLLHYGADVNATTDEYNVRNGPALDWAIIGGHVNVVRLLLAHEAVISDHQNMQASAGSVT